MIKKNLSANLMEQIVDCKLSQIIKLSKMCTCKQCCADLRALVLNNLPPQYVASHIDEIITSFDLSTNQIQADVTKEIMFAIKKLSENPRH